MSDIDSDFDDDNTMDTDPNPLDSELEKQLLGSDDGSDKSSSSGNSDDEDEMDAEDAAHTKLLQKYHETLDKINKNKYSYDDYVILINLAQ